MNVLSLWCKPQSSQWNQKGSQFSTRAVFLFGQCQSAQDKAGHYDRKSEDFPLKRFSPCSATKVLAKVRQTFTWSILFFDNFFKGMQWMRKSERREEVIRKGRYLREIRETVWRQMPQNGQKWPKEKKNPKAKRVIVLIVFAQVGVCNHKGQLCQRQVNPQDWIVNLLKGEPMNQKFKRELWQQGRPTSFLVLLHNH